LKDSAAIILSRAKKASPCVK